MTFISHRDRQPALNDVISFWSFIALEHLLDIVITSHYLDTVRSLPFSILIVPASHQCRGKTI